MNSDKVVVKKRDSWFIRIGDFIVDQIEKRKPHHISKKKYCICALFFGWLGVHQFLVGKTKTGVFYALTCWTGLSIILTVLDLFFVLFMPTDENKEIVI